MQTTRPISSVSALVAAAFDPAVGTAAFGVHPGDSRAAGIKARAASLHLAAPCGNQQPIRVISSSVYAMHAVYAIDAVQQAAGAPVSP